MKTTLILDDTIFARLKREAARRGESMSALVESALRRLFDEHPPRRQASLEPLPSFDGGAPLVDISDRDALYDRMGGR
jgi:hypothetical protein